MLAIYKREVRSYFQSMVGCVFVAFLIAASDSSGQSVEGCAWKISCNGNGNWNPECDLLCVPINH